MMATSLGKEGYFQTKIIVPSIARDSILSDCFSALVVGDTDSRERGLSPVPSSLHCDMIMVKTIINRRRQGNKALIVSVPLDINLLSRLNVDP
jgi:hypothetical protein